MSQKQLPPSGLFVTGTDTGVGKTHIAAMVIRELRASGHRVGAYKPVCSGATATLNGFQWDDIERLRDALGEYVSDEAICPQRFFAPVAPPLAAQREGKTVDFDQTIKGAHWWGGRADTLIVEGAGGLLAPVTDGQTVADLCRVFEYSLVIVARCGLGTINHTLLTIEAARRRDLKIAGIVLNQTQPADDLSLAESNAEEIEKRGGSPVLGIVEWGSSTGLQRHGCPVTIRWFDLAGR